MTANLSRADQVLRIILGLFLLSLIWWGPQTLWGLAGIILLATSGLGFCPIYAIFGISTKGKSGV